MNATTQTVRDLGKALVSLAPDAPLSIYRRFKQVMADCENENSVGRDLAIGAIISKRPAYWTSAKYHSAASLEMCNGLNRGADMQTVLADLFPPHRHFQAVPVLDTMIPLNGAAIYELADAYEHFGTFREYAVLEARADRRAS